MLTFGPFLLIGPLDTTVVLKYPLAKFKTLTSAPAVATFLLEGGYGPFDADSIAHSSKPSKKNPDKTLCTAAVQFNTIGDAYAVVTGAGRKYLEGMTATWAAGKEPGGLSEALKSSSGNNGLGDVNVSQSSMVRYTSS